MPGKFDPSYQQATDEKKKKRRAKLNKRVDSLAGRSDSVGNRFIDSSEGYDKDKKQYVGGDESLGRKWKQIKDAYEEAFGELKSLGENDTFNPRFRQLMNNAAEKAGKPKPYPEATDAVLDALMRRKKK